LLTVAWLGVFIYLGLASRLPEIPGLTGRGESVASTGHFVSTLVLAVLIFGSIRVRDRVVPTLWPALVAIAVGTLAGGAIELLQSLSRTRTPQLGDWLFDGLGAVVGVALIAVFDIRPSWRPGLVTAAHVLGIAAAAFTLAAFFVWQPIESNEVTAFCPPTVEDRRVPSADLEAGLGSRVADGLLALYGFDESADDSSDDLPRLDLALGGDAVFRGRGLRIGGDEGVARSLAPATKIYEAATATDEFTVEAWVRPRDLLQRGPARIVTSSGSTSLGNVNFHLGQERTCLSFRVATGAGEAEWLVTGGVFTTPQSTWHVVVTYDGGTVATYAEGMLIETATVEPGPLDSWDPTLPLLVGNEATLDRPFAGDIFLVAVYGRALSAEEVSANYRAGALAR
jgi:VanZ family protein